MIYNVKLMPKLSEIEILAERNPDIPIEVIVKEDLLRQGISWSPEALAVAAEYKRKAYFIFSFDMVPISGMKQQENIRAPEEVRLVGGQYHFRPVVVSVRLNPDSPYSVETEGEQRAMDGNSLVLKLEGDVIAGVELQKTPEYYRKTLSNGRLASEIAPTIEWGYLLYLTVFRLCQYPVAGEGCLYCDINENYRQQKKAGRHYEPVKSVEEVMDALEIAVSTDGDSKAYTITGGSITGTLEEKSEIEFYARYPEAIERRWPGRWISKAAVQALPKDEAKRLKDAGIQIYHPNFEIWDARLFETYCPGKARHVGRNEWIRRILDAADIFGPENVIPNFVAGVEMAPPMGFDSITAAITSTIEGLEFFMRCGILPRFTTWCPEPLSVLGAKRRGAPLEYYIRLLRAYRDLRTKYKLPTPRGYGEPGLGRAIFSVSSFMDVL